MVDCHHCGTALAARGTIRTEFHDHDELECPACGRTGLLTRGDSGVRYFGQAFAVSHG